MWIKRIALIAGIAPIACAYAQTARTPTLGDLERIQAQTIILKAEASQAAAAAALAAKGGESDLGGVPPVVSDVYGGRGGLFAHFLYANGASVVARAGDHIPGGYRVLSIALNHVRIEHAGKVLDVGFSGATPTPVTPAASPGAPQFSGFPAPIIPAPGVGH